MKRICKVGGIVLLSALILAGCGGKDDKVRYAVITGSGGISDDAVLSSITAGVESYAGENGAISKIYAATDDSEEACKAQIDTAAEDGARYVIVCGKQWETAVYDAQGDHQKQRFLYFDGEPRKNADDEESSIRKNTECLRFGISDIGFLAGYACVRDGIRNIAFVSAENSGDTAVYYEGFRRGIAYAENELMLTSSDLALYAEFCGSASLSPRRLGDALDFYASGIEVIVTDQAGIAEAADRAAAAAGSGSLVTLGFDATAAYSHTKFSAVADCESATRTLLGEIETADAFKGGSVQELGASEYAAMIVADFSRFTAFGQDSYRSILNAMAQMSQAAASAEEGEDGETGGASVYGAADADSVTVAEVSSGAIAGNVQPTAASQVQPMTVQDASADGTAEDGAAAGESSGEGADSTGDSGDGAETPDGEEES